MGRLTLPSSPCQVYNPAILLMPDKLLRPQPAPFAHLQHNLDNARMPLAVDSWLFDVEDKGSCRLQHTVQLIGYRQKPIRVFIGLDASVGGGTLVRVGGRRYH